MLRTKGFQKLTPPSSAQSSTHSSPVRPSSRAGNEEKLHLVAPLALPLRGQRSRQFPLDSESYWSLDEADDTDASPAYVPWTALAIALPAPSVRTYYAAPHSPHVPARPTFPQTLPQRHVLRAAQRLWAIQTVLMEARGVARLCSAAAAPALPSRRSRESVRRLQRPRAGRVLQL